MNRIENGKVKKTAGMDVVDFLRLNQYMHPVLIYQGEKSVPRTIEELRKRNITGVYAESSYSRMMEFALFSPKFQMNESSGLNGLSISSSNEEKLVGERSMTPEEYDQFKTKFYDEVQEYYFRMKDHLFGQFKITDLDLYKNLSHNFPSKEEAYWNIEIITEIIQHKNITVDLYLKKYNDLKGRDLKDSIQDLSFIKFTSKIYAQVISNIGKSTPLQLKRPFITFPHGKAWHGADPTA